MEEFEKQMKSAINKIFIMPEESKTSEIDLLEGIDVNFSKFTTARVPQENYEIFEMYLDYHYKEACNHLNKHEFRKIFNVFVNAESYFYQLVASHFSPETVGRLDPLIAPTTKLYLRVGASMLEDENNLMEYFGQIATVNGVDNVLRYISERYGYGRSPAELSYAFFVQDMFQSYLSCISEEGLRTDFHSYTEFISQVKLFSDQLTEVLWKMNNICRTD